METKYIAALIFAAVVVVAFLLTRKNKRRHGTPSTDRDRPSPPTSEK